MDSDNESYHSESDFFYLKEDFRYFRPFHGNSVEKKIINKLFAGLGRSVLGKTVLETSATVCPKPNLPGGK